MDFQDGEVVVVVVVVVVIVIVVVVVVVLSYLIGAHDKINFRSEL